MSESTTTERTSSARKITIDPITRLEGHGKIEIFLDDSGDVDRAYIQIPELRGFEKFLVGRPAEEMPQLTSRICGVCPSAHHMASTKALDSLFGVEPPPAARCIRELFYNLFFVEDHALHFYFLGGPDFIVGPDAPAAQRNVLGVIAKLGVEVGRKVIDARKRIRAGMALLGGKAAHPVLGLPGGVAKPVTREMKAELQQVAEDALEFAKFTLKAAENLLLDDPAYLDLILSEAYTHQTYYMGMVDEQNHVSFYDGQLRVVTPAGKEWRKFPAQEYRDVVAEHVEPWTFVKFCYLKPIGWTGFADGESSGVYSVAPLARLNAAEGMSTPLAQQAYERMINLFGKPVHHTLANHFARVIELVNAAEKAKELSALGWLGDPVVRNMTLQEPREGIGVVEAPRGTLIHHYTSDARGVITGVNLIVATQHNAARIALSVDKAAKALIHGADVPETMLNRVEMAFRAYDPCNGCATHAFGESAAFQINVRDRNGNIVAIVRRDSNGLVTRS